jgi:hypothetical protein
LAPELITSRTTEGCGMKVAMRLFGILFFLVGMV